MSYFSYLLFKAVENANCDMIQLYMRAGLKSCIILYISDQNNLIMIHVVGRQFL